MTVAECYAHLLLGKTLSAEFPTAQDAEHFRNLLSVHKHRQEKPIVALGIQIKGTFPSLRFAYDADTKIALISMAERRSRTRSFPKTFQIIEEGSLVQDAPKVRADLE